jgi:hypothetical protein
MSQKQERNITSGKPSEVLDESGQMNTSNKIKKIEGKDNIKDYGTRAYLEQTVVAIVTQGMSELAKERPENPLEFLGNYLLKHSQSQQK